MSSCKNCKTCENRVFDEERGKYICKKYDHPIRDVYKYNDCVSYKEKK